MIGELLGKLSSVVTRMNTSLLLSRAINLSRPRGLLKSLNMLMCMLKRAMRCGKDLSRRSARSICAGLILACSTYESLLFNEFARVV